MKYDSRLLWDCNSDLDSDFKYRSTDVHVVNALIKFTQSNSTSNFQTYYNSLVSSGQAVALNLTNFDTNSFFQKAYCFDFDLDGTATEDDALIYEVFQAWLDARDNLTLQLSELNEFKKYYNSLITQGIINVNPMILDTTGLTGGTEVMLPTLKIDEEFYVISTDGKIPKVVPGGKSYDETDSKLGANVDASLMNFMVSDPGVKTYYDWDGTNSPRSWKRTGICKVLNIKQDELKEVYGIVNPPVELLVNRNLPITYTPLGTKGMFHGKTISIYNDKLAVSGTYLDSGVVYIYQDSDQNGNYVLIHEVIVPGTFTEYLPIIEMHDGELFVANPTVISNQEIFVYDIETPNVLTISNHTKLSCPLDVKKKGFGSCMNINANGDVLVVGNPTQYITKSGNIDHYNTGDVDYPTGAVYIYRKSGNVWSHAQTIFPSDLDEYVQKDANQGNDSDIHFGYSVNILNNDLLIGSPRAYSSSTNRRTGCVYVYTETNNNFVFNDKIISDEVNMNTLNITTGNFNFGLSVASTASTNKLWILQNVPGHGTYVGEYESINGTYEMQNSSDMFKISNDILGGYVEIGSDNQSVVYGTEGALYLLDTT